MRKHEIRVEFNPIAISTKVPGFFACIWKSLVVHGTPKANLLCFTV